MNIFKIFTKKGSIQRKVLDIEEDIKSIVKAVCNERFWIIHYGVYDIDPKCLVFFICVLSDAQKRGYRIK